VYLIDEFCEDQRVKRKKGPKEVRYLQNVKRGKREQVTLYFTVSLVTCYTTYYNNNSKLHNYK